MCFLVNVTSIGHDGITSMINCTASNACEGEMVARTTIKLCSDNRGQECYMFVATKEVIQQFVDGELAASFSAQVPVDMKYTSTLYRTCVTKGVRKYAQQFPL